MNVSAVIVTRGDVDLGPILDSIPIDDIVVWNNAEKDLSVYGRYAAIDQCRHAFIYTQDDDAICPVLPLLSHYNGDGVLANVPDGERPWLGWGSIFPRDAPFQAFRYYLERYPYDELFRRWADVVFAELALVSRVDFGHVDMPWATAQNRMAYQPDHYTTQEEVRERCHLTLESLS
jgi:hypothetical protein